MSGLPSWTTADGRRQCLNLLAIGGESSKEWEGDSVGCHCVVCGVSKVLEKVVQWVLAGGCELSREAQEGNHGQPPILNLLHLQCKHISWFLQDPGEKAMVKAPT